MRPVVAYPMLVALALGLAACNAGEREVAGELRERVIDGVQRDFDVAVEGPSGFASCFTSRFRHTLTDERIAELATIHETQGEPAAARALNGLGVRDGDSCGGRRWVPELTEAARGLRPPRAGILNDPPMAKRSAGILLYRTGSDGPEVLLVHPGGPFWARRDAGSWSIPKGEYDDAEEARACALREFEEETGTALPPGELIDLGDVKQKSGKVVTAWAAHGDFDADAVRSNTFTMEWPPKSGRTAEFPEIDRAGWFAAQQAREKLVPAQAEFVDRLLEQLA